MYYKYKELFNNDKLYQNNNYLSILVIIMLLSGQKLNTIKSLFLRDFLTCWMRWN